MFIEENAGLKSHYKLPRTFLVFVLIEIMFSKRGGLCIQLITRHGSLSIVLVYAYVFQRISLHLRVSGPTKERLKLGKGAK